MTKLSAPPADHPVIGALTPWMPDTVFCAFRTRHVHGLACVRGMRIDFLAIAAEPPGRGHLTTFLKRLQQYYAVIGMWEVGNTRLAGFLTRHGFTSELYTFDRERAHGVVWRKGVGKPL